MSDVPRFPIGWSQLADLAAGGPIGIYGLGREGQASRRCCRSLGIDPVLVDDDPREPGVLATADGGLEALKRCAAVVVSPGIPRRSQSVRVLDDAEVLVVGGLGLWLGDQFRFRLRHPLRPARNQRRIALVTGTKGKSTTSAIAAHLLTGLGYTARVVGNIGVPPFDPDGPPGEPDYWIVEVSSYQAVSIAVAPRVVAVTSLHPDHLPWHGDAETYFADKLSICTLPGAEHLIANGDSDLLGNRPELTRCGTWVRADDDPDATWPDVLGLPGAHNRRNALIAREILRGLGVTAGDDELARAAAGFAGLESRLQVVTEVAGVRFVDDGLSTNVLPTLAAVDAFPGHRVALIVGGQDRGIDYAPLAVGLAGRENLLVLTVPDSGDRIAAALAATALGPGVEVRSAPDLAPAVRAGFEWARTGPQPGVVLLSPAAPSFGRFTDYRHRGAAFAEAAAEVSA